MPSVPLFGSFVAMLFFMICMCYLPSIFYGVTNDRFPIAPLPVAPQIGSARRVEEVWRIYPTRPEEDVRRILLKFLGQCLERVE